MGSPRRQRTAAVTLTLPSVEGFTSTEPFVFRTNTVAGALTGAFQVNAAGSTCSAPLETLMQPKDKSAATARRPNAATRAADSPSVVVCAPLARWEPIVTAGMSVPPLPMPYETISREFPQPDAPVDRGEPQRGAAFAERRVQAARAERPFDREREIR